MTQTVSKTQLNVRINPLVEQRLDDQIALAKRAGRRVTKEALVENAITATYPEQRAIRLPVHHATLMHGAGTMSNAELLDLADRLEADEIVGWGEELKAA